MKTVTANEENIYIALKKGFIYEQFSLLTINLLYIQIWQNTNLFIHCIHFINKKNIAFLIPHTRYIIIQF